MEIKNIRNLIESKLACIDIECDGRCDSQSSNHLLLNELHGIRQALSVMGIRLEVSVNPYYPENKEPSTYTIFLEK